MADDYLSVEEAARQLGIAPKTVRKMLRTRQLRGGKFGNKWRIHVDDLKTSVRRLGKVEPETQAGSWRLWEDEDGRTHAAFNGVEVGTIVGQAQVTAQGPQTLLVLMVATDKVTVE